MNRNTAVVWTGAAFYALAWLIPVDRDGLSGWQAFRSALAPVVPYEGIVIAGGRDILLSVTSAASNLLFAGFVILTLRPNRRSRGWFWPLLVAGVLNTHWFVLSDGRSDLWFGYYLWVASFFWLSVGARRGSPRGAKAATNGI